MMLAAVVLLMLLRLQVLCVAARVVGIAGGPIAELVVLPRAPVAEAQLPFGAAAGTTGTGRSGGAGAGGDVGPNVQAEAANVADVGGHDRIGGVERVAAEGHLAGIAVGPATPGLLRRMNSSSATSASRGMSIPTLVLRLGLTQRGIVRGIHIARGGGRVAPSPGSAAGGHAPSRSEGRGPIRTGLRGRWAGQQSSGARDAAESKVIVGACCC